MKKLLYVFGGVILALSLTACSEEDSAETKPAKAVEVAVGKEKKESNIDTSVFEYAKNVEVTDSRESTQHINLVASMDPEMGPGLAVQHVVKQSYDFIQQSDVEGADKITVGIMQGDTRIAQYTVDTAKFTAGEDKIDSVIAASKIEKMESTAKEYGATTGKW